MGIDLTQEFAQKCVDVFRANFPEIPQCWYKLQDAFARCVEQNSVEEVGPVTMEMKGRILCMNLPSGRALHYVEPRVEYEQAVSKKGNVYTKTVLSCEGINQVTRQWERIGTWGGKLFENLVQALCRDILAYGMVEATKRGFDITLHVHDEVVADVSKDSPLTYVDLEEAMCVVPPWAPGFLIGAEGFESEYYRKGD